MVKLLILTRQFATGGAERQLITLLQRVDKKRFDVTVASFYDGGGLCHELSRVNGIRWIPLHKQGRWDIVGVLCRISRLTKQFQPHVIYGYMGPSHHISLALGKLVGAKVVWGVRASNMDSDEQDWLMRLSFWLECKFSKLPDLVIANSNAGKDYVINKGFSAERITVINNGIDTARFRSDLARRNRLRKKWKVAESESVIGLVARLHPMKDHPNFLRAASMLSRRRSDVKFVCIGNGPSEYGQWLKKLAEKYRLGEKLIWDGEHGDMVDAYNAMDISCSVSAYGEGFSNTVAEAMACGTPCVVTNVGDSALIVGEAGIVIPPKDSETLASSLETMLHRIVCRRGELAQATRGRIVQYFSAMSMVAKTQEVLAELLDNERSA